MVEFRFLLAGTGAIQLTGLVFVAMSLNLKEIARDATHRNRAINTLTGLTLVFMRCACTHGRSNSSGNRRRAVCRFLRYFRRASVVKGYVSAIRMSDGLRFSRKVGGSLIQLSEMIGAALFFLGFLAGLYIAAIAIVSNTCYMITATWLLVIGAFDRA